jgi:small subunit ribosomal protein S24e
MKFEIVEKKENPLLKRIELRFKVTHEKSSTPTRAEVKTQIALAINVPEELVVIEKFASLHGKQEASGIARVYESKEILETFELKYLLKRGLPKEEEKKAEKPAEAKAPVEEKKEKPEKPAEEKPKEKAEEKPKAEKPKEG